MELKLAWRNLWRNKRRTLITMASVFFAVVLSSLMMSLKEGFYSSMIDSIVGSYSGYGQIHSLNYWEDKSMDNSFVLDEYLDTVLHQTEGISEYLERAEGVALAISDENSKVALVSGINVSKEKSINQLNERIIQGHFLEPDDKAILIGSGLADYLKLEVNDTLVLLGQGYHGSAAAGKYPVKGIIKFGSPELSKQMVFLPIKEAQWLYGMEGLVTTLVIKFDQLNKRNEVIRTLKTKLGKAYEVMGWEELMPEVKNMIETDRIEGYVFMFILYMVVSFGILGTLLMMLSERNREFGVLVSIGMKRIKLAVMVWLETMLIVIAGAVIGIIGVLPISYYFNIYPIKMGKDVEKMMEEYGIEAALKFSVEPAVFIQQAVIICLIATFISIYPFIKLLHLNAIKSMRS